MTVRPVELWDLQIFLVLAEELHFGRTAERVGVTQSRVSQVVRQMEIGLGGRLLDRTSRRVELTPLGERLDQSARQHYLDLNAAIEEVASAARGLGPTMRLGLVNGSGEGGPYLQEVIDEFEMRHPSCVVRRVELPLTDPLAAIRKRSIDLMCSRLPLHQPDLEIGPILSDESRVLLVSRSHPLARRDRVSYEELADFAIADVPSIPLELRVDVLPLTTPGGRPIPRGRVFENISEVLGAVAAGEIVHPTAISNLGYRRHPQVVDIPITDAPPTRTALVAPKLNPSPAARSFVSTATSLLRGRFPPEE